MRCICVKPGCKPPPGSVSTIPECRVAETASAAADMLQVRPRAPRNEIRIFFKTETKTTGNNGGRAETLVGDHWMQVLPAVCRGLHCTASVPIWVWCVSCLRAHMCFVSCLCVVLRLSLGRQSAGNGIVFHSVLAGFHDVWTSFLAAVCTSSTRCRVSSHVFVRACGLQRPSSAEPLLEMR